MASCLLKLHLHFLLSLQTPSSCRGRNFICNTVSAGTSWFHLLGVNMFFVKNSHSEFSVSTKWCRTELKDAANANADVTSRVPVQALVSWLPVRLYLQTYIPYKYALYILLSILKMMILRHCWVQKHWSNCNNSIMPFSIQLIWSLAVYNSCQSFFECLFSVGHLINQLDSFDVATSSKFRSWALKLTGRCLFQPTCRVWDQMNRKWF